MRCVLDRAFGYIFNPWSDGTKTYHNNNEGKAFKAMAESPESALLARAEMFRYRAPEEFYDLENDPSCLKNLANDPVYGDKLEKYRKRLALWMEQYGDPVADVFKLRHEPVEMRGELEEVYENELQSRKRAYEQYMRRVSLMKKQNFE